MSAEPTDVFHVLLDATAYPAWVVGAKRIRRVDEEWPAPGSRFHHRVGVGPAFTDDSSRLLEVDPPRHLVLEARFRPLGTAIVVLDVSPLPGGGSRITMEERPVEGAVRRWWNPLLEAATLARNQWSLCRLAQLVEQQHALTGSAETAGRPGSPNGAARRGAHRG